MPEKRTFTPVGDRMIMCDLPCPAKEIVGEKSHVIVYYGVDTGIITDPLGSGIPLCDAPEAPVQFETTLPPKDYIIMNVDSN